MTAKVIPLRSDLSHTDGSKRRAEDEGDLVHKARQGDRWAMGELFERYHQKIYNMAFWMCGGSEDEARDATQEAFLRAFEKLEGFRGDSSFYTWLCRIAINVCLDNRKRAGRWKKLISCFTDRRDKGGQDEALNPGQGHGAQRGQSPLEALESKEFGDALRREVLALPEQQRLIFYLRVYQDMSTAQVASITGLAPGTVKTHLFRAMKSLRHALREWV